MKIVSIEEMYRKDAEEKERKANDPKHLEDGLESRKEIGRSGYGKNEEVGQVK